MNEDPCPGYSNSGSCTDPHCIDRQWGMRKEGAICEPYSPPVEVCGTVSSGNACAPACCRNGIPMEPAELQETRIETLAAEIAAAVEKARETRTVELTDPHASEVLTRLIEEMGKPILRTHELVTDVGIMKGDVLAACDRDDLIVIFPHGSVEDPSQITQGDLDAALAALRGEHPLPPLTGAGLLEALGFEPEDAGPLATAMSRPPVAQESILMEAERIVNGPRRESYGHPAINFARIAHLWNGYLQALQEGHDPLDPWQLTPQDVCQMMIHLKQCRLIQSPDDRDGHVDVAGYAQCSKLVSERRAETLARMAEEMD